MRRVHELVSCTSRDLESHFYGFYHTGLKRSERETNSTTTATMLKVVCGVMSEDRSEDLFAKKSSVTGKRPGLAALVDHEGRWATLVAGLVPSAPRGTLVDLTPKYLTLVASSPG